MPERTNMGNLLISTLNIAVKTKVIAAAIKNGFINAKEIPSIEEAYFVFSCETAISRRVWR